MPTVATSPSTLVHSCEGMYFKPSMTVRVATREARSSVIARRAVPPPRLAFARVAQGAHPDILSAPRPARSASPFARASALERSRATSPTCHARASLDASSRFTRAPERSIARRMTFGRPRAGHRVTIRRRSFAVVVGRTGGVRARADRGRAHGRERGRSLRPSQERRSRRHRAEHARGTRRRRVRTTRATTRRPIARVGASRVCRFYTQMKTIDTRA